MYQQPLEFGKLDPLQQWKFAVLQRRHYWLHIIMGNIQPTQQKYYQAITGKQHSATSNLLHEKLQKQLAKKAVIWNEDEEVSHKCRHQQQEIHSSKRAIELSDGEKVKPWCKCRLFTEEETESITKQFALYIESNRIPTRAVCQEFVDKTKSTD